MPDDFYAQFMRGFASGNAISEQRRRAEQDKLDRETEAEERKIRREALMHQAKGIKLQEAIQTYKLKREGAQQQVESAAMQQTPQIQPPAPMQMGPEGQPGVSPEEAAMMVPVPDEEPPTRMATMPGLVDPNSGEQLIPETQTPIKYGDQLATEARIKKHRDLLDELDKTGRIAEIKESTEARFRAPKEQAGFTLSPGQTRYEGGQAVASMPDRVKPKGGAADAQKLRKEFDSQAKPYVAQRDSFNRVLAASTDTSGAGDIALIFNYMKTLDPGSTVREGEFATAQSAGRNIPQTLLATYNRLVKGERLTPDQRKAFADSARAQFESVAKPSLERVMDFYGKQAEELGLNPDSVIGGLASMNEAAPVAAAPVKKLRYDPATGEFK